MNLVKGDKPFWDKNTNSLYFGDLFGKAFYRYDYDGDEVFKATVDGDHGISFILPVDGRKDRFLVGADGTAIMIDWDGESSKATKVKDVFSIAENTFVDAAVVGPNNNIIAGGFGAALCKNAPDLALYEYTNDKQLYSLDSHYTSTIGLAINTKWNILYQLDACEKHINAFDYNPKNGDLCKYNH